jgi:primosomal protein N'
MAVLPISRQPVCRYCDHEEHVFSRCEADLGSAMCPCPPHHPPGIYTT